jgi:hypothetical protein
MTHKEIEPSGLYYDFLYKEGLRLRMEGSCE